MAADKSTSLLSRPLLAAALVLAVLALQLPQLVRSQDCAAHIGQLMSCTPYLVPGGTGSPSQECCGSLANVDHSCACSAFSIISRLPSLCHVPTITCSAA